MQLPKILQQEAENNRVSFQLDIEPELEAFEGHFDSFPIVPGVVQIGWALTLAQQVFATAENFTISSIDKLKFQQVITPGQAIDLVLENSPKGIRFEFSGGEKKFSSGIFKPVGETA